MSAVDTKVDPAKEENGAGSRPDFKLYKRRWFILILYLGYVVTCSFQWIQYAIIAEVIMFYYKVPSIAVTWTSMVYMVAFVVTIFPATWFYNKVGLRVSLLLAMGGACLGAWIKVFSVRPDLFWVTMLGQTVVALSQVYVLSIPVSLAATWFGPKEVSTACSIGVIGSQIGGAFGFFIPVMLVPDDEDIAGIESGLSYLFYGCAIFATVVFILQLIFMRAQPPTPPSNAQANRSNNERESVQHYIKSLWKLVKNLNFMLIFAVYGIHMGALSAVTTFLSQMVHPFYPDAQDDVGYMGVVNTVTGFVGSVLIGFILDRTKRYKEINIIVHALSTVAMIAFTFVLRAGNLIWVYVTFAIYGFTMVAYLPAAFEFASELTYPEPEASSAGLMTFGCQIISFLFTLAYGWVFEPYGDLASNLFMSGSLVLGTVITFFVKSDLRRQQAEHSQQ